MRTKTYGYCPGCGVLPGVDMRFHTCARRKPGFATDETPEITDNITLGEN